MSAITASPVPTSEVSLFRLYLLRAMYLLVVVGLGNLTWPDVLNLGRHSGALLCLLGLRYPLQMIPVLLWKAIGRRSGSRSSRCRNGWRATSTRR